MELPMYKSVIGLRHKRMFNFTGCSGKMIDYLAGAFDKERNSKLYISKVAWKQNGIGVRVSNKEENFTIDIDFDGLVLSYNYYENDDINLERLVDNFKEMSGEITRIAEASKNINRIGISNFYNYNTGNKNPSEMLNSKLLTVKLSGISDSFGLRFALKNPTTDSLVRLDTADYTNAIFAFQSEKDKEEDTIDGEQNYSIDINLDYQIYFNPERAFSKSLIDDHFASYNRYVAHDAVTDLITFVPAV